MMSLLYDFDTIVSRYKTCEDGLWVGVFGLVGLWVEQINFAKAGCIIITISVRYNYAIRILLVHFLYDVIIMVRYDVDTITTL